MAWAELAVFFWEVGWGKEKKKERKKIIWKRDNFKETETIHKFMSNLEINFSPWLLLSSPVPSPLPLNYCSQKLKQNVLGVSFV